MLCGTLGGAADKACELIFLRERSFCGGGLLLFALLFQALLLLPDDSAQEGVFRLSKNSERAADGIEHPSTHCSLRCLASIWRSSLSLCGHRLGMPVGRQQQQRCRGLATATATARDCGARLSADRDRSIAQRTVARSRRSVEMRAATQAVHAGGERGAGEVESAHPGPSSASSFCCPAASAAWPRAHDDE